MEIPRGFRPHTLASLLARNLFARPALGKELALSACPTCDADHEAGPGIVVINRLQEADLIQFAERESDSAPAIFVAPDSEFPNDEDRQAADRLVRYFDHHGTWNVKKSQFALPDTYDDWVAQYPLATRGIAEACHLSRRVVEETLRKWWGDGWERTFSMYFAVVKDEDGKDRFELLPTASKTERLVWAELDKRVEEEDKKRGRASYQHLSYMRAVEAQYAALAMMQELRMAGSSPKIQREFRRLGLDEGEVFNDDIVALRAAETYCWFKEPLHAVDVAAASLPATTQLRRDMVERGAGWWYFMEPYQVMTLTDSEEIRALLWDWVGSRGNKLRFSVYAPDTDTGRERPSTVFMWKEGESLTDLLTRIGQEWENRYSGGSVEEAMKGPLLGRDQTVAAVERIARLWAAGVIWIEQKILVFTEGPIERHERKRMERGHFQRPVSDIAVIELRRRHSVPMEQRPGESRVVDWSCRWIVRGHWREQWYASEGVHRSKFIEAYPKGPDDKPLKVPTHTVYAVKR